MTMSKMKNEFSYLTVLCLTLLLGFWCVVKIVCAGVKGAGGHLGLIAFINPGYGPEQNIENVLQHSVAAVPKFLCHFKKGK